MIYIRYQGRHGNFIFQYFFGRYISFLTNQAIESEENYYRYTANRFIKFVNNESSNTQEYKRTVEINDKNVNDILVEIMNNCENKNFIECNYDVKGFFQDGSLYNKHPDFLKDIIIFNEEYTQKDEYKNSVLIHLRLDDFHRNGYDSEIISFKYYDNILRNHRFKNIYILYDESTLKSSKYKDRLIRDKKRDYYDYDKKYIEYFVNKYLAKLKYSKNVNEDFMFFQNFDDIILSGSSFGFWGVANKKQMANVHIPTHKQLNSTHKTYNLLQSLGHNVKTYDKIHFVNYNEDQVYIGEYYPSCEGYVTDSFELNKNVRRLYLSHHAPVAGFFSNCSMGLYNVVKYYNITESLPDKIDMTLLFQMYKKGAEYLDNENQSLCKILCLDDCICKSCNPNIKNIDGVWTGRFTHNCYRTRDYDLSIGPYYFKNYEKPKKFQGPNVKCKFAHWSQFYPYTNELMNSVKDLFKLAFSPSENIENVMKDIQKKYDIDFENTCVLFMRRGDKRRETSVPEYNDYIIKLKDEMEKGIIPKNIRILVQSDETEFYSEMKKEFSNSFELSDFIRKVPSEKKGQPDLGGSGNLEFSQKFLAVMNIMAQCKYIYANTGNCSLWTYLYRTLYKEKYNEGFNQWIGKGHHWKKESIWLKFNKVV